MYPKKYIKDLESSRRRSELFKHLIAGGLFVLGFLFIGPLIHEISHALWLEFHGCFYQMNFEFTYVIGIRGMVDPGCNLNSSALVVFYAVGYLSTLLTGTSLDFYARTTDGENLLLSSFSIGLLISVLATIGLKGDLQSLVSVLNAPESVASVISAFIMLGIISLTYKTVKDFNS